MKRLGILVLTACLAACSPGPDGYVEGRPWLYAEPADLSSAKGKRPEFSVFAFAPVLEEQREEPRFTLRAEDGQAIPLEVISAQDTVDTAGVYYRVRLRPTVDLPEGWSTFTAFVPGYNLPARLAENAGGYRVNAGSGPVPIEVKGTFNPADGGVIYQVTLSEMVGLRAGAAEGTTPVAFTTASQAPMTCVPTEPFVDHEYQFPRVAGDASAFWSFACPERARRVHLTPELVSTVDGSSVRRFGEDANGRDLVLELGDGDPAWRQE